MHNARCTIDLVRLANFEIDGERRVGVVGDGYVSDLSSSGLPGTTVDLIREWDRAKVDHALTQAPQVPIDQVRLMAPLVPKKNIMAVGRNYRDHAKEFSDSGFDASEKQMVPDHPVIFTKAPTSVIGPGEAIVLANDPTGTTDYEGEMAVVIGMTAKRVEPDDALEHVFGWTIVNDVTARDLQKRHVQWFVGKSPDTFCPMGPWITTIDELPDIGSSWLRTTVNGELRQETPISALIFDIETLIATLSEVMTLEPGDVIATGTGLGVGIGFDPPRYLAPGDVVEVSVDGIGSLSNPVIH
jgi:2-keto-4-pentenoate hydratase/2-oxohepta-3-ene-1,7-dioic acid hydratase in catechol pathway